MVLQADGHAARGGDTDGISIAANALTLNGATIRDNGGNDADLDLGEYAISEDAEHKVDGSIDNPPAVESICCFFEPQSGDTFSLGERIEIHVHFTEVVTVTGTPQVTLTLSDTETRTMDYVGTWRDTALIFYYEVQSADRSPGGLSVSRDALILNDGTIRDANGNDAVLDLGEHEHIVPDPNRKVDGSIDNPAAVVDVHLWSEPRNGDTYALGERVGIGIAFNERITVTGSPRLTLTIGTARRSAEYTGVWEDGTGFGFEYEIQADDRDTDGISIAANALTLNGATIRDNGGNDADLDLGEYAISEDAEHKVDGSIDNPPAVESICCFFEPQSGDTFSLGERIEIHVHFTEVVTVTGTPQVTLTLSDTETRTMDYVGTWRDTALIFYYEVQSADRSPGGLSVSRDALILNDGTIRDANGNDAVLDLGEHEHIVPDPNRKVDGSIVTAPRVRSIYFRPGWVPASGDTYELGELVRVRVLFDRDVNVTSAPQLALIIGTETRQMTLPSTELGRKKRLDFTYTVQANDHDADGISIPANSLQGGAVTHLHDSTINADLTHAAVADDPAHKVDAGPQIGCKQPGALAARVQPLPAEAQRSTATRVRLTPFELALELEENRDGSGQAVQVGCVALVAADRRFSYEITDGNDGSRFAVGTSDGMISYVGSGENAERTPEYLLTVTAAPQDAGEPAHLPVRIAIANVNDPGIVTLSATQPVIGQPLTAALDDEDRGVQDASWQWWRQAPNGEWTEIQDVTAAGYTPVSADAGHSLQARVTYADEHGAQQAASAPTETVDLDALRRERILRLGLAGFGRTVASAAVNAIGQRFGPATAAGEPGTVALDATLNRQPLHFPNAGDAVASGRLVGSVTRALGVRVTEDETVVFNAPSGAALLANSAFSVEYSRGAGRWGVWGYGDLSGFEGKVDGFEQDGSVLSAYLGADYRFVPNALAGLAASYSQLDLTSTSDTDGEATLKGTLISAYPYGFWMPEEWLGLWALAGFGTGTAELDDVTGTQDGEIRMWLGATGQRVELLSSGGLSLAAKSDGFVTGLTSDGGLPVVSANAWRARLLLEGGLEWRPDLSRLAGSVEVGARLDGGDAEQGLGAEAGAELSYAHTGIGLMISGRGRILLAHEDDNLRDWGVSAMLRWEPPALGSGPALAITPVWGVPESGVMALWQDRQAVLAGLNSGSPAGNGARWLPDLVAVKLSYGVEMPAGGRLVPYAEIDFGESAARRVRAGATVDISDPAASHGLLLEAFGQHEARDGVPSYHFGLEGTLEY